MMPHFDTGRRLHRGHACRALLITALAMGCSLLAVAAEAQVVDVPASAPFTAVVDSDTWQFSGGPYLWGRVSVATLVIAVPVVRS